MPPSRRELYVIDSIGTVSCLETRRLEGVLGYFPGLLSASYRFGIGAGFSGCTGLFRDHVVEGLLDRIIS